MVIWLYGGVVTRDMERISIHFPKKADILVILEFFEFLCKITREACLDHVQCISI